MLAKIACKHIRKEVAGQILRLGRLFRLLRMLRLVRQMMLVGGWDPSISQHTVQIGFWDVPLAFDSWHSTRL